MTALRSPPPRFAGNGRGYPAIASPRLDAAPIAIVTNKFMADGDSDSDTPEPRATIGDGVRPVLQRLRGRMGTANARAGLYFVLGAITASVIGFLLLSSNDAPVLADRTPLSPSVVSGQHGVVATARAETLDQQHIFQWTSRDGTSFRAKVDAEQYARYAAEQQQRIDLARIRLTKETEGWVQGRLRPVLSGVEGRVGDYGDWMYNWWTAWILLGQGFGWTWDGFLHGKIADLPNLVHVKLTEEIRGQYDDIVLRLEILEPQMQALLDRAVAGVQREILQICGPMNDARQNFIRGTARQIERKDPGTGWVAWTGKDETATTIAPTCGIFDSEDDAKLTAMLLKDRPMSNLDAGVDEVILRLSRPFATKLISFMVLPVAAAVLAGGVAVPFVGLPAGAVAGLLAGGTVSGLVIGFSSSAAVDWLLTRADEALSRPTFEADLRRAVRRAADSFEVRVAGTMKQYVERQYQQLALDAFGRKP